MPKKAVDGVSGKRVPLNMKTTEDIRQRLEEAAATSGRSLTAEVEYRVEQSFINIDKVKHYEYVFSRFETEIGELRERLEALTFPESVADLSSLIEQAVDKTVEKTLRRLGLLSDPTPEELADYEDHLAGWHAHIDKEGLSHLPLKEPSFAQWKAQKMRHKAEEYYEPPDEPQGGKPAKGLKGKSRVE